MLGFKLKKGMKVDLHVVDMELSKARVEDMHSFAIELVTTCCTLDYSITKTYEKGVRIGLIFLVAFLLRKLIRRMSQINPVVARYVHKVSLYDMLEVFRTDYDSAFAQTRI